MLRTNILALARYNVLFGVALKAQIYWWAILEEWNAMRFNTVYSAYFMGITLPTLEVIRRKTNFEQFAYYADDFIIGALLVYSANAVTKNKSYGMLLLSISWAILCGGFYYSFFGQVYSASSNEVSGMANTLVIVIKGCLFACAICNLIFSVKLALKNNG